MIKGRKDDKSDKTESIRRMMLAEIKADCTVNINELKLIIQVINAADIYDEYYLKFSDGTEFSVSRVEGSDEWIIGNPMMHNAYLKAAEDRLNEVYALSFDNAKLFPGSFK